MKAFIKEIPHTAWFPIVLALTPAIIGVFAIGCGPYKLSELLPYIF